MHKKLRLTLSQDIVVWRKMRRMYKLSDLWPTSNEIDNSQDRGPFTSASPFATAGAAGRLADAPGQDDPPRTSFWLRNKCHDGFVVVKEKTRVLAQHEGLDRHNEEGKFFLWFNISFFPFASSSHWSLPFWDRLATFDDGFICLQIHTSL